MMGQPGLANLTFHTFLYNMQQSANMADRVTQLPGSNSFFETYKCMAKEINPPLAPE